MSNCKFFFVLLEEGDAESKKIKGPWSVVRHQGERHLKKKRRQRMLGCASRTEGFCLKWPYFLATRWEWYEWCSEVSWAWLKCCDLFSMIFSRYHVCKLLILCAGAFPLRLFSLGDCSTNTFGEIPWDEHTKWGVGWSAGVVCVWEGGALRGAALTHFGQWKIWVALNSHHHSSFSRVQNFPSRFSLFAQKHWYYCITFLFNNSI